MTFIRETHSNHVWPNCSMFDGHIRPWSGSHVRVVLPSISSLDSPGHGQHLNNEPIKINIYNSNSKKKTFQKNQIFPIKLIDKSFCFCFYLKSSNENSSLTYFFRRARHQKLKKNKIANSLEHIYFSQSLNFSFCQKILSWDLPFHV